MPWSPPHANEAGERGFALIEALVSSVILLIVVIGLLSSLDVQSTASGQARAGSVAAALAEADQERLRSFRVPDLADREETRTETVSGATYTVESKADWIRDDTGGGQSCANASSEADYLRLTSTVTGRTDQPPVQVRSLIAPPVGQFGENHGTVAVKVEGGAGQPLPNLTATITGPKTSSLRTNQLGCAVFAYVPVGAYGISVSAAGYVTPAGTSPATDSATATEGTVNLTSLPYDRAGSIAVSFESANAQGNLVATTSDTLSVANSGVGGSGVRSFTADPAAATIAADKLFPFQTPYTVYAGSCPAANPAMYSSTYFNTNQGSVTVTPGGSNAITVKKPRLSFNRFRAGNRTTLEVTVRSTDPACTDTYDLVLTTDGSGYATPPLTGMPFGTYRVCARANGRFKTTNVTLTSLGGAVVPTLDVRSSSTPQGVCPS